MGGARRVLAAVALVAIVDPLVVAADESGRRYPLLPRSRFAVDAGMGLSKMTPGPGAPEHQGLRRTGGILRGSLAGAGLGFLVGGCMVNPFVQLFLVGELSSSERWALLGIGTGIGAGLGAVTGWGSAELVIRGKEREAKACAVLAGCLSAIAIAATINSLQ